MIFEGLIEGEGRTIGPAAEELLFVRPRTSCSAVSSEINKGLMQCKSVHLLEGREEKSVKSSRSSSLFDLRLSKVIQPSESTH